MKSLVRRKLRFASFAVLRHARAMRWSKVAVFARGNRSSPSVSPSLIRRWTRFLLHPRGIGHVGFSSSLRGPELTFRPPELIESHAINLESTPRQADEARKRALPLHPGEEALYAIYGREEVVSILTWCSAVRHLDRGVLIDQRTLFFETAP